MTDRKFLITRPVRSGHIARKIGLLGGSFNPAHRGHRHISVTALKKIGLDEIWWLVTPGNPLKDHAELETLTSRVAQATRIANHPRIRISTFEADHRLKYTADTIPALQVANPATRFVWLMGADNLATIHHWERWHDIATNIAVAVLDRPGYAARALRSPFAQYYQSFRLNPAEARLLPSLHPPAWVFLHGRTLQISSTSLRKNGGLEALGAY